MDYEQELATIQKWIKATAGLNSWRRTAAPPALPRPVIVWESPHRSRKRNLHRYAYTQSVKYYGKLYANSMDECLKIQGLLLESLENALGRLAVTGDDGKVIGYMKEAEIVFTQAEGLDIPFTFSYEAAYSRQHTEPMPPPKFVYTKVRIDSNESHNSEERKLSHSESHGHKYDSKIGY